MNDAHDNSADDKAMLIKIQTDLAIEAFRVTEQKRYQLELKEYILAKACRGNIDIDYYYAETEKVRAKYEQDRVFAAARGLLPREGA